MQPGSPETSAANPTTLPGKLPTSHEPLPLQKVTSFSEQMDRELSTLEDSFRDFWTPSSFQKSLSR